MVLVFDQLMINVTTESFLRNAQYYFNIEEYAFGENENEQLMCIHAYLVQYQSSNQIKSNVFKVEP